MAHINRRYIDKHWLVFIFRGVLAVGFALVALFGMKEDAEPKSIFSLMFSVASIFLLFMGIIDSVSALYASAKKHGWLNSVIDALVDVAAAIALLFFAKNNIIVGLSVLAVYTVVSGLIDIFHGFLSTVDPTDRFIRILVGVLGCIMGAVIINAGGFEQTMFFRFFGVYMMIVGITSLIYGVHNRSQNIEDKVARKEIAKKSHTKKTARKK